MPRLLIDLSAWARSGHADARDRWAALLQGDHLLCHPVFALELLHNATDPGDYRRLREDLDKGFDWVWLDGKTADIAIGMQQKMATSAPTGQRVKTADLLIAALAVQHGVGVLHYDADYDLIRDRGGESFDSEWLAKRGSLEGAKEAPASARRAYSKAFGRRMVQLQDDVDLEVWPELIDWMNDQLLARGIDVPPPPDVP
ncbi:MAG: PIN domain-containing protein [Actinomycetota bacterium]|nr:PIN domain-containing protein [Actinomycetota bacterium]